ncbi:MAG: hypothetical protein IJ410_01225 [Oscillospiraceae bacterium]|nr:hypothetical protein [Oscillospiraceae bacterium]
MDYSFRLLLSPLLGGMGVAGRFVIALGILAILRFLDKNDPETDKGIRKLLVWRIIFVVLAVFVMAFLAGLYIYGFAMPLDYLFDFIMW